MAMVRCPICYAQNETSASTCISCQNSLYFQKNTACEKLTPAQLAKSLRDAVKEYDVLRETTFKRRRTSSTSKSSTTNSAKEVYRKNQNKVVTRSKGPSVWGATKKLVKYTGIGIVTLTLGWSWYG